MSIRHVLLLLSMVLLSVSANAADKGYRIVTENYPPYNYEKDGKVQGFCTDVVKEIMKRLQVDYPIELTDWNNAYHLTLNEKNYIVYSMNKTKLREPLFKWVGPLLVNKWAFLTKANEVIILKTLDDAKKYKVGTYYNDVCEDFLNEHKFDKIECVNEDYENVKKLVDGKIDLWLVADLRTAALFAKQAKVDVKKIKPVCYVQDTNLYIGFNRNAPDELVKKFQTTLDAIKKDGTYHKIYQENFPGKPVFPENLKYLSIKKKSIAVVKEVKESTDKMDAKKADSEKGSPATTVSTTTVTATQETITLVNGKKQDKLVLTIKLSPALWEQMHRLAKEKNMSIDTLCRKAFANYLRDDKKARRKRKKVLEKMHKPKKADAAKGTADTNK